jgi:hypothetical protein
MPMKTEDTINRTTRLPRNGENMSNKKPRMNRTAQQQRVRAYPKCSEAKPSQSAQYQENVKH